jgi:hypothetical protein
VFVVDLMSWADCGLARWAEHEIHRGTTRRFRAPLSAQAGRSRPNRTGAMRVSMKPAQSAAVDFECHVREAEDVRSTANQGIGRREMPALRDPPEDHLESVAHHGR